MARRKGRKRTAKRTARKGKRPRTIAVLMQTGSRKDISRDRLIKALPPGKRISASGLIYWETRRNRSDKVGQVI